MYVCTVDVRLFTDDESLRVTFIIICILLTFVFIVLIVVLAFKIRREYQTTLPMTSISQAP